MRILSFLQQYGEFVNYTLASIATATNYTFSCWKKDSGTFLKLEANTLNITQEQNENGSKLGCATE